MSEGWKSRVLSTGWNFKELMSKLNGLIPKPIKFNIEVNGEGLFEFSWLFPADVVHSFIWQMGLAGSYPWGEVPPSESSLWNKYKACLIIVVGSEWTSYGLTFRLYMHPEKILSKKPLSKRAETKEQTRTPTEYAGPVLSNVFIISAFPRKRKRKKGPHNSASRIHTHLRQTTIWAIHWLAT